MTPAEALPAYHRQIAAARDVGLRMTRAQLSAFIRLLEQYAEDLASRVATRGLTSAGARDALELAQEMIRQLSLDLARSTGTGVRITADRVAALHAEALAGLMDSAGGGTAVRVGLLNGIGSQAAASVLSRPELSIAFRTIRKTSVEAVDGILRSAILRGATSRQLAMELRLHIVGADALPAKLLLDRRRIGYDAIRALGYDPTPENLALVRSRAGQVAAKAQLIARTEPMNAQHEAHARHAEISPVVAAHRWRTSSRHSVPDQCDALRDTDFYGMGPGVYPAGALPIRPHPRCICPILDILRPVEDWGKPREPTPALQVSIDDVVDVFGLSPSAGASLRRSVIAGRGDVNVPPAARTAIRVQPLVPPAQVRRRALSRMVRARENEIRGRPVEWASAWNPQTGQQVLDKTDRLPDRVYFSEEEVARMKDAIFTHNHPRSTSLSPPDILFARATDLQEIRVASRKFDYSLRRPDAGWPQPDRVTGRDPLVDLINFHDRAVQAIFLRRIRAGQMSPDEADLEHMHRVWQRVWRDLGAPSIYRRRSVQ